MKDSGFSCRPAYQLMLNFVTMLCNIRQQVKSCEMEDLVGLQCYAAIHCDHLSQLDYSSFSFSSGPTATLLSREII